VKVEVALEPDRKDVWVVIHAPAMTPDVAELAARLSAEGPGLLPGFRGTEVVPLDPNQILRFYGAEKEICAQTAEGSYTVRQRLYELETRLDRHQFVRISHSEIVNLRQVTGLDLSLTGTIRMTLTGGVVTYVSRRYVKKIKEALGL